jgi:F0F1-type ATP synthase assembly protein I
MSQTKDKEGKNRSQYTKNLALAAVAGQVGCVTLIIVVVALIAGLWLDNRFETRPLFLVTFLIGSVPVTVIVMLWIVRSVTARIKPSSEAQVSPINKLDHSQEEANRGTDA